MVALQMLWFDGSGFDGLNSDREPWAMLPTFKISPCSLFPTHGPALRKTRPFDIARKAIYMPSLFNIEYIPGIITMGTLKIGLSFIDASVSGAGVSRTSI